MIRKSDLQKADKWQDITLGNALRRTARQYPDREAVVGETIRWTYREFDALVDKLAAGMIQRGVQRGDHVAVWMANVPQWTLIYMACARIGAIIVPINTRYKAEEVAYILRQSDARMLIMMERFWNIDYLEMLRQIAPEWEHGDGASSTRRSLPRLDFVHTWGRQTNGLPTLEDLLVEGEQTAGIEVQAAKVSPDDALIIVYTSGTTGHPKGAMHSHRLLRNGMNIGRAMGVVAGDRLMAHMPFYHVAGAVSATLPSILIGGTLVTLAHWSAEAALRLIADERITVFGGIPTHFIDLFDELKRNPRDTSCLRTAWIGGASVTPEVAQAARDQLKLDALQAAYGMTETSAVTTFSLLSDPVDIVCENKGKVIGDFEVKVFAPDSDRELSLGEDGEVRVRGYPIMMSYYKDAEATREALTEDGWFKTGDLGRFDAEGYLKITGRVKDMFIVGGSNAYPAEIERIIETHPAVRQAIVVGVPDHRLGEVGFAFAELTDNAVLEIEDLKAFCKTRMADFKVPRFVQVIDQFPKTSTGKIQRFVLAERAREAIRK